MPRDAFLFYVDDWLSSGRIELMDAIEERGYLRLLLRSWKQLDCGLPTDDLTLAAWSKMGSQWFRETADKSLRIAGITSGGKVKECFVERDGRLFNERLVREREYQEKINSARRENGSLGGRPKKPDGKANHNHVVSREEPYGIANGKLTETNLVSGLGLGSKDSQKENDPAKSTQAPVGFDRFWGIWSSAKGTSNHASAVRAWLSVVTPDLAERAIECAVSYLNSLDNLSKGFNPDNFIFRQFEEKPPFSARWKPNQRIEPQRQNPPTTSGSPLTDYY